MDSMFVSLPPQTQMLKSQLLMQWYQEVGPLGGDWCPYKRDPRELFPPFCHVGTQGEDGPSPDTESAGNWFSDFPPPELLEINVCCLNHLVYGLFITAARQHIRGPQLCQSRSPVWPGQRLDGSTVSAVMCVASSAWAAPCPGLSLQPRPHHRTLRSEATFSTSPSSSPRRCLINRYYKTTLFFQARVPYF